eukprot:9251149-Pyramimonas_sp.AAC.2
MLESGTRGQLSEAVKARGRALFAPEKGGSYDVWKKRPLPSALMDYAAGDVQLLHKMKSAWLRYSPESDDTSESQKRIKKAVEGKIAAKGRHMSIKDF